MTLDAYLTTRAREILGPGCLVWALPDDLRHDTYQLDRPGQEPITVTASGPQQVIRAMLSLAEHDRGGER